MPAIAEPPAAPPVVHDPNASVAGIEKSPLFAALDAHLDPNKRPSPTPAPATPPGVTPTTPTTAPAPQNKPQPEPPKSKVQVETPNSDPLSSLLPEKKDGDTAPEQKRADIDLTDFDKEFPDDPDHAKADPKANEHWKKIKTTAKEAKREAAALKAEKEELQRQIGELSKTTPPDADEVKSLRDKIGDYEKRDAVFKLENDPKFQNEVLGPLGQSIGNIKALLKKFDISEDKFQAAVNIVDVVERNQAISKLVSAADIDPTNLEFLNKNIGAAQDLAFARERAYQDAEKLNQASAETLKQEKDKEQAKRASSLESADKDVWDKLSTKAEVFKDILSDDATALDIRKKTDAWMKNQAKDPTLEVYHAYAGFMMKPLQAKVKELTAELQTYKDRVEELSRADAPAGGGGAPIQRTETEKKYAPGEAVGNAVDAYHAGRR